MTINDPYIKVSTMTNHHEWFQNFEILQTSIAQFNGERALRHLPSFAVWPALRSKQTTLCRLWVYFQLKLKWVFLKMGAPPNHSILTIFNYKPSIFWVPNFKNSLYSCKKDVHKTHSFPRWMQWTSQWLLHRRIYVKFYIHGQAVNTGIYTSEAPRLSVVV